MECRAQCRRFQFDIQDISELRAVVRRSEPVERWTPNHTEIWEDGYKRLLSLLENA